MIHNMYDKIQMFVRVTVCVCLCVLFLASPAPYHFLSVAQRLSATLKGNRILSLSKLYFFTFSH